MSDIAKSTRERMRVGRSNDRRNVQRTWFENETVLIVKIEHRDKKSGEFEETAFRLFTKDGSPGWKYQRKLPSEEVSLDRFVEHCGLDTSDIRAADVSHKVYQFCSFLIEELEMVSGEDGGHWVEAQLFIPALDLTVPLKGGRGITKQVAKRRFFTKFNECYPGCELVDEEDEMEGSTS